jgi:hypothetical protein
MIAQASSTFACFVDGEAAKELHLVRILFGDLGESTLAAGSALSWQQATFPPTG